MRQLTFVAALLLAGNAEAGGLQFQCGPSKGYAYYAEEGIAAQAPGWTEDSISKGESVIDFDLDNLTIDYRFKSASGVWKRPATDGGTTSITSLDDDMSFVFMAIYPPEAGLIEIVTVAEIDNEAYTATMLLTQVKNDSMLASAKILKSDCKVVGF